MVIVKTALILFYLLFLVLIVYWTSRHPWYKYHITRFGVPAWAVSTLIVVWFVCVPSAQHSRWFCFGWFAFWLLPICLWAACLFAKIMSIFMNAD